jgi:hypothetical protein
MKRARSTFVVVAAITACGAMVTPSIGQKYKQGDKVVVLADADLKIEATNAGIAYRGQVLTIGQAKGEWLWVESNSGPDKLEDCLPSREVLVAQMMIKDSIESIGLSNPADAGEFSGFSSTTTATYPAPLPVRPDARWGKPSGKPVQGWIRSSSVAPAIDLRVQGTHLYYSVPQVERLTRQRAPKHGLWPFGVLSLAIIKAERSSAQSDGIRGVLYVQPVAVKQPNTLDLPAGRCGLFLVVTRPGQSPMPGSGLVTAK